DLPLQALFRAYVEARLLEQWMGTKVLRLDDRPLGAYRFETTDPKGTIHLFQGCIHELEIDRKISRTFEMVGTPYPVQFEIMEFEPLGPSRSRLVMQVLYRSVEDRDNILKLPFAQGINWAHDRLQQIMEHFK